MTEPKTKARHCY